MSEQQEDKDKVPGTWDEIFKHPRFKELNQKAKDAEKRLAEFEAANKTAEEARLTEEKKWQDLAEKYKADLAAMKSQADGERLARLRLEIGTKTGLPVDLANLLQGKDETELTTHAQTLLAHVKPATPGVPPAPARQPVNGAFTPQQLNDPEFVRKNQAAILANLGQ